MAVTNRLKLNPQNKMTRFPIGVRRAAIGGSPDRHFLRETTLNISDQQKTLPLSSRRIKRIIQAILTSLGVRQTQLSLVFVTDRKIHSLNKKFLKHDFPTDVLAFDLSEPAGPLSAEIIISTDTARRQAKQFHASTVYETVLYLAHGILHLCGHDDHRPRDIKRMRAAENAIMGLLQKDVRAWEKAVRTRA